MEIHHFPTGPFNWYVIEDGGRLTLVDAGFPGHYGTFVKGLASIGRKPADLEAILLTHGHADHTGFAERLRREFQVPVYAHRADIAMTERALQLPWFGLLSNAWRPFTAGMLTRATVNGVFSLPSIAKVREVVDGQQLDVPGKPSVLHVPGHTPGEIAFYIPQKGVLISGDALVTRSLFTGRHGDPQLPDRLLNSDTKQALQSLDRFMDLGRVTMLPGHGRPWTGDMRNAVELARAGIRR